MCICMQLVMNGFSFYRGERLTKLSSENTILKSWVSKTSL